ncbi:hypothetical protein [Aeromonas sobria]
MTCFREALFIAAIFCLRLRLASLLSPCRNILRAMCRIVATFGAPCSL